MYRYLFVAVLVVLILVSCSKNENRKANLSIEGDTTFVDGAAVLTAVAEFKNRSKKELDSVYFNSPYDYAGQMQKFFFNDSLRVDVFHTGYVGFKNEDLEKTIVLQVSTLESCFIAFDANGNSLVFNPREIDPKKLASFVGFERKEDSAVVKKQQQEQEEKEALDYKIQQMRKDSAAAVEPVDTVSSGLKQVIINPAKK